MIYKQKSRLDIGLLVLRIGIGIIFIGHGFPKLAGGPEKWEAVGSAMSSIGIDSLHIVFGFLAAITEVFGGIFLIFGLYTVPILVPLIITMFVAMLTQIAREAGYAAVTYPIAMITVFVTLIITGPGRHSLDHRLAVKKRRRRI